MNTAHPRPVVYESVHACIDHRADVENHWYWGPQSDGTEVCESNWIEFAECVQTLSCEDQGRHWDVPPTSDYPCKAEELEHLECSGDNPTPQEGGE